jgi:hypothetical protein
VRGNFTQRRIEVFRWNILLFKNFEKACEGRFSDPQRFGEALKLLSWYALRLCDENIATSAQMMGGKAAKFPPV